MRRVKPAKNLDSARFLLLRRRILRYLPRKPVRVFASVGALIAASVAIVGLADFFDNGSRLSGAALAATGGLGFTVQDVEVEGRDVTPREDVLKAIDAERGTPIFGINPARVKKQLESLPWVRTASVERHLPDTLYIRLTEREPLALWQHQGKMALIDRDGTVITSDHLDQYSALMLVVGDDAPPNAEALITVLDTEPELMHRVGAAIRVGGRRWNLQLDNNITVELPENNIADAWTHLAQIDHEHSLLARDIEQIDLRLADRVVVRTVPEPPKPAASSKHSKTAAKT
jgi:cell division protein FtsQ